MERDKKEPIIGFRVSYEEKRRFMELVERVQARNRHMDITKVLREIIGFDPMVFVTEADLDFLRGDSGPMPSINPNPPPTLPQGGTHAELKQNHLFSTGGEAKKGKARSRKETLDIQDVKKDARERTKRKTESKQ